MKKLVSFVLVAVFAAILSGTLSAQERGEHRRGGEHRRTDKSGRGEAFARILKAISEGKMTREEAAKKLMQLRGKKPSKKSAKRGSKKPVAECKDCKCSCHKKATKKSGRHTQERRSGRRFGSGGWRGRGRTPDSRSGGSRWGRGRNLLHLNNRA